MKSAEHLQLEAAYRALKQQAEALADANVRAVQLVMDKQDELDRLRTQAEALADANALAAELMAQLTEAQQQGEELELQHEIDHALSTHTDADALASALLKVFINAEALALRDVGQVSIESQTGSACVRASVGDVEGARLGELARRANERGLRELTITRAGQIMMPLSVRDDDAACVCLLTQADITQWRDRWGGLFRSFAQRIGAAFERIRISRELEHARDEALEASRTKSQFLANMSHELRTPLNAILGYSELLGEELRDVGHEEFEEDLDRINRAGKHLLSLINDVLDISKIEAGKMEVFIEPFKLPGLLREVVDTISPLVAKNNNKLSLQVTPEVGAMTSDPQKLKQSLLNLLSNASKFTNDGTISLQAWGETRDNARWYNFSVIDTGIGMDEAQCAVIFDAFTQVDSSSTRKVGGTGLGLAITRRFCQLLGGDIWVESRVGSGTRFTISLPDQRGAE